MSKTKQLSDTYDMYDEFDCEEGENEEVQVKEEDDSETDYDAVENVEHSAGNGKYINNYFLTFTLLIFLLIRISVS